MRHQSSLFAPDSGSIFSKPARFSAHLGLARPGTCPPPPPSRASAGCTSRRVALASGEMVGSSDESGSRVVATSAPSLPVRLVGDGTLVPCVDGQERPYLSCDAAASTAPLPAVLAAVEEFLPWYSSVHRGAGYKSQRSTDAYETARESALSFAGRDDRDDVAIICRNTTEAINHLAYRLRLAKQDVVLTTVVEHHANLLPWARAARCRYVECGEDGTFASCGRNGSPRGQTGAEAPRHYGRLQRHRLDAARRGNRRRGPRAWCPGDGGRRATGAPQATA